MWAFVGSYRPVMPQQSPKEGNQAHSMRSRVAILALAIIVIRDCPPSSLNTGQVGLESGAPGTFFPFSLSSSERKRRWGGGEYQPTPDRGGQTALDAIPSFSHMETLTRHLRILQASSASCRVAEVGKAGGKWHALQGGQGEKGGLRYLLNQ